MRLADIKGDKAFEVLADLLDPISSIAKDKRIREAAEESYLKSAQIVLREHTAEVKVILALLDLEDPETYEVTLATLPKKFMEVVNDPDVMSLFTSQGQMAEMMPFGSAMESTEEGES